MSQTTSYYLYQKYEQRGEQEPIPVYPNYWSKDGDGTQPLVIKQENDPNCGYVPPVTPMYRWTNIEISQDYVCDDCPAPEPQYRWVNLDPSTDYYCDTTIHAKYYKQRQQVSYDNGSTWSNLDNYQRGGMYESNSVDCGYVPPTPSFNGKFKATYSGGQTYSADCDSSTTLTSATTKPSGYQYSVMTSAEIGSCVQKIDFQAFYKCSGLTSVTISSGVTTIGNYAFEYCTGLPSVTIPDSVTTIGIAAFIGCSGLTSITIPDSVTTIGGAAFQDCIGLTSVTISSGVTQIGGSTFGNCRSLPSITIPDSVTTIGDGAFGNCTGLTSVTIPDSVTSIGNYAFQDCGLTSVNIGSGVTSIGSGAFRDCKFLTSITIPSGVTSIGQVAFQDCDALSPITCLATTPPTLGNSAFEGIRYFTIKVPASSVNAYKTASGWSNYASMIQAIP